MKVTKRIKLKNLDLTHAIDYEKYEKELKNLQEKLSQIQQAFLLQQKKAVIVFEGVDAAGKGGVIRRITWALDPRGFHVYPISAPSSEEKKQHYLQRFWKSLPDKGTLSIFDRSWYGRVLVERIEKFASKEEWQRAYREINEFEKQLTDDGVKVIKIFLHVSAKEQLKRFKERLENPKKRWKLTYEDFRNREKQIEYINAFEDMFTHTSTVHAPWHLIASDDKKWSRIETMKFIVKELSSVVDLRPAPIDPKLKKLAKKLMGKGQV